MFERSVRCLDCGFLGIVEAGTDPYAVAQPLKYNPAAMLEREPQFMLKGGLHMRGPGGEEYSCVRGINLGMEQYDTIIRENAAHGEITPNGVAWLSVLTRERSCQYFERWIPGANFERHLDAEASRLTRTRTEVANWIRTLAGLLIGFALGLAARFIG